jgi:hypothetical protein
VLREQRLQLGVRGSLHLRQQLAHARQLRDDRRQPRLRDGAHQQQVLLRLRLLRLAAVRCCQLGSGSHCFCCRRLQVQAGVAKHATLASSTTLKQRRLFIKPLCCTATQDAQTAAAVAACACCCCCCGGTATPALGAAASSRGCRRNCRRRGARHEKPLYALRAVVCAHQLLRSVVGRCWLAGERCVLCEACLLAGPSRSL